MVIFEYLASNNTAFVVFTGILGLLVGSFLNVVILRLPVMMEQEWRNDCLELFAKGEKAATTQNSPEPFNLFLPRSHCPQCGYKLKILENIPVISWIGLKGRCSACRKSIAIRYPVIEITTSLMTMLAAVLFGYSFNAAAAIVLTWALIVLSLIDLDTRYLPDSITIPFVWLGLLVNYFGLFATLENAVIGATAGYAILWLLNQGFRLATGKEGMGHGDFKLLAMLGAWLGWQALPIIIFFSSLIGAIVGICLIAYRNHNRDIPLPFGPFLAGAGWCSLFWGGDLLNWYFS